MAEVRESLVLKDRFSQAFSNYIHYAEESAAVTEEAKKALSAYAGTAEQAAASSKEAGVTINITNANTNQYAASANAAASATSVLSGSILRLASAYLSLQGAQKLLNLTDAYTQTTARLDRMNDGLQTTEELQNRIMLSAQRSRGAYQETADMVSKLGTLAGEAFGSTQEIIDFAEQLNKQFALAGTSAQGQTAAMLQLTQAMSSGVLRGEELNSILDQAPTITMAIADYLDLSVGEMRELASQGQVSAEVVKNALFAAAEETNAAFSSIPMTWGQLWTQVQNVGFSAIQPLLEALQTVPQMIADNWDAIEPVVVAVAAALGVLTAATLAQAAAQWVANSAMLANPITWVVLGVAALVLAIYAAVEAWNHFTGSTVSALGVITGAIAVVAARAWNIILSAVDLVLGVLEYLVNPVINWINFFANAFTSPISSIVYLFQSMADTVLGILEKIAGAIDALFGSKLANAVSGWRTGLKGLADDLVLKYAPDEDYKEVIGKLDLSMENFGVNKIDLGDAWNAGYNWGANLDSGISDTFGNIGGYENVGASDTEKYLSGIDKNVGSIAKSVDISQEDLKSLVDMAERQYINQINLTAQSPVVQVSGANTGNTEQDRQALADAIRDVLLEQSAAGSLRSTARANT